jgi:hypothetical protein
LRHGGTANIPQTNKRYVNHIFFSPRTSFCPFLPLLTITYPFALQKEVTPKFAQKLAVCALLSLFKNFPRRFIGLIGI